MFLLISIYKSFKFIIITDNNAYMCKLILFNTYIFNLTSIVMLGLSMISKQDVHTLLTMEKSLFCALIKFSFVYKLESQRVGLMMLCKSWCIWGKSSSSKILKSCTLTCGMLYLMVNYEQKLVLRVVMIVCYPVPNTRLVGWSNLRHLIKQRSKGVGYGN
jgi:hypothetical protein